MQDVKKKIVIVDDEVSVHRFLKHSLEAHGFDVVSAHNGNEGLQRIVETKPDVIILDYGMPDLSGIEVLKKLREWSHVPVIFLTVRDDDESKVDALDSGADDYLTKPFSVPELMARIRVVIRRIQQSSEDAPVFKIGALEIDRASHLVRAGGKEVKLTATEYNMLCLLTKYAGKVVPHRTILKEIWGPNSVEHDHYLRVYFSQIRKKLDANSPGVGSMIENESSVGYRLRIR